MKIYKYQIENELKALKEIDTSLFDNHINRITSKSNKIIRTENNKSFSYYCTHCGKWHTDKKVNIKSIKKCPHCKRVYEVIGKRNVINELKGYITVLETNERNELIIRQFYFCKMYKKLDMSFDVNCFEIERINIDRNVYMKMNTSSNMGCLYHAYNGKINSDKGYYGGYYGYFTRYADIYYYNNVFTKGIKKLIKNTSYRYSCLDIVARKHIDIYKYLKKYKNHNEMELFVKNGNFKLIKDIIENNTFPSALENRKNIKYLKDDINITEFKNAVRYDLNKIDDIKAYGYVDLEENEEYIHKNKLDERKTCHYLYKQKHELNYYDDYLNIANKIGMNLKDKRILYPKNLTKAHDKVMKEYKEKTNAAITKNIFEYAKELEKFNFKNNELVIFPAESQEDIIKESKVLEHCVRTYAKKVAARKTSIFFIRKKKSREEPYVTLELRENRVMQCRGYKNNVGIPLDEKVKFFVNDWCKKFNLISCF